MNVSLAIMIRIWKQLYRDKKTFAMIIVMPFIITLLFGYALTGETYNNPVIIINHDTSIEQNPNPFVTLNETVADSIISYLLEDEHVNIVSQATVLPKALNQLKDRDVRGVIVFPMNFTEVILARNGTASILTYLDEVEPSISNSILLSIRNAMNNAFDDIGFSSPVDVDQVNIWGNEDLKGIDYSLPSVMSYIIMFLALLLTALILIRDDVEGTKPRFYAAPVKIWHILVGYVISLLILSLLMIISVVFVGIVIFHAVMNGSYIVLTLFLIFFALPTILLGMFLAKLARNEMQAMQMSVLVAIPSAAVSGFLVPVETLPWFIRPIAVVIPLTYAIDGLKSIMLRGLGFAGIQKDLIAFGIYSLVTFLLSFLATRKTMD